MQQIGATSRNVASQEDVMLDFVIHS